MTDEGSVIVIFKWPSCVLLRFCKWQPMKLVLQECSIQQPCREGVRRGVSDTRHPSSDGDDTDQWAQPCQAAGQVGEAAGGVCCSARRGIVAVLSGQHSEIIYSTKDWLHYLAYVSRFRKTRVF